MLDLGTSNNVEVGFKATVDKVVFASVAASFSWLFILSKFFKMTVLLTTSPPPSPNILVHGLSSGFIIGLAPKITLFALLEFCLFVLKALEEPQGSLPGFSEAPNDALPAVLYLFKSLSAALWLNTAC